MKKEFIVICKNCKKEFFVIEEETKFPIKGDKYFCCRSCANTRHHSNETKLKISNGVKTSEIFLKNNNTNRQKIYNKDKQYQCIYCKKYFLRSKLNKSVKYCSVSCKEKYNNLHKRGGYRKGAGRSKHGYYKGIWCDSTWELCFLIYHLDNNLYIERSKEIRKYIFNGKEYSYYPDFITDKGIIEIKGYITEQSEAKRLQNPDIIVLQKPDMQFYISYVMEKYNVKNLSDLYDAPLE